MASGIQSLVLHPNRIKHNPFRIIYPFTVDVWVLSFVVFCIVALFIFIFNRWDPYEWKAAAEKGLTFPENADNFTFKNSLWFCATTLFLQSFDNSPRSNAGRCIAGFWWLFVLAMVFLYMSNLLFFVNSNRRLANIKTPNDLLSQTQIRYGTIGDGNTNHYFENILPAFWHEMNNDPDGVYVDNTRDGLNKVRSSNGFYAFLGESRELEWIARQKPCEFQVVGEYIARTQYGFAVAKDSPLAYHLSGAIETLRVSGVLEDLERDWWHLEDNSNYCTNMSKFERNGAYSMTVNDISGAYYLLAIGMGISILVFIGEIIFFKIVGPSDNAQQSKTSRGAYQDRASVPPSQSSQGLVQKPSPTTPTGGGNMWI